MLKLNNHKTSVRKKSSHFFDIKVSQAVCVLILAGFCSILCSSFADAGRFRPKRKANKYSISYRSNDPKSFHRALSHYLEQQPPEHMTTIEARAAVAEMLFQTGNYREAAQIYLVLSEAPLADRYRLSSFQYRLAECYFQMTLYGEAYDQFSRIRQDGHLSLTSEATLGMAMSALAQGNRSSAQAHLDILLLEKKYYKNYPRALYPLGIMLFQNEQYKRALGFFEKDLDDPTNLYFAGISYRRIGNLPKALSLFQRLTQKFPGTVWSERGAFEVAESYFQQQDFQLAYQSYQRWLKEYPNGTLQNEAQFRLACTDLRRKNYKDVITRLSPLLKYDLRPELAERVRHLVSESWVELGEIEKLVSHVRKRGRARDRAPDENYQLMWALTALNKYPDSLTLAEDSLNVFYDPELTPKILLIQGFSNQKEGKTAEALAAYQTVVDRFPGSAYSARALHLMALSYVRARRWQELVTHVYHHWANLPDDIRFQHPDVEFWITEGQLSLGNYKIAQRRYQEYLTAAPDQPLTPYAYLGLAVAKAQDNQLEEGLQTLQQFAAIANQKKRRDWVALATLQSANINYNQKNYEQAIGFYKTFQKEFPQDTRVPQAMYQEAQSLYRLEYYKDSVDVWDSMAKNYPKHELTESARFQAARTLFDLGETTAAVKAFDTFIVKHPHSDRIKEARLQLAHAYYNAENYKRAIPKYEEFLALYPNSEEAVSIQDFLQMSYVKVGKTFEELEQLTQGQKKSQALADLYWEKGANEYNEKEYESALIYFEKILIDFPASSLAAQAAFYRAESLYLMEYYDVAGAAYKNFLAQFPNDGSASTSLFRLGVCLFNQNRFDESAITFENFVQKYPDDPLADTAAENIPMAYAKLGKNSQSARAYEALLQRTQDPERRTSLLLQLAQMKEGSGQAAQAISYYEKIPLTATQFPEARYSLGVIYSRTGQMEKEIQAYEKLLGVGPKDNPYRISAISRLAELYISQGKVHKALAVYKDVAKNATDSTALANAKTRLEELQKVLSQ
ncbi:hypothetical protein BVX98_00875 [bacterium F11]|nr:hypothetical protein BVX98_00875 [bacterium F11]